MHSGQYLNYSSHHETSCKESIVSSLFRAYSIIQISYDLTKENARIKQVLKENGYQETIIIKIFKIITYNHSNKHKTDIQEEEFRMSINLLCGEGEDPSENLSVYSQDKIYFPHW